MKSIRYLRKVSLWVDADAILDLDKPDGTDITSVRQATGLLTVASTNP